MAVIQRQTVKAFKYVFRINIICILKMPAYKCCAKIMIKSAKHKIASSIFYVNIRNVWLFVECHIRIKHIRRTVNPVCIFIIKFPLTEKVVKIFKTFYYKGLDCIKYLCYFVVVIWKINYCSFSIIFYTIDKLVDDIFRVSDNVAIGVLGIFESVFPFDNSKTF